MYRLSSGGKIFINQAYSVKVAGYWPRSFFGFLLGLKKEKVKTDLANIQPYYVSGGTRGGARAPPLDFEQTEVRRDEKNCVLRPGPPPLITKCEGLDPPLYMTGSASGQDERIQGSDR